MDAAELRNTALRLLSRREYSRHELEIRFIKSVEPDMVNEILDELVKSGYLSDSRFTESFIRQRVMQRHGWQRISYDLKSKGIAGELQQSLYEALAIDWVELAYEAWQKRFNQLPERGDRKEYARQMRYLLQRGFSSAEASSALRLAAESLQD
jgi:regulatory protein